MLKVLGQSPTPIAQLPNRRPTQAPLTMYYLDEMGFDYNLTLRDYQINAIKAVETHIKQGQNKMLIEMATGTGKTKTAIAMIYR